VSSTAQIEQAVAEQLIYEGGKTRLFLRVDLGSGFEVTVPADQMHYLLHVMRAKEGDRLSVFNGRDGEWAARILRATKRTCTLVCEAPIQDQREVPDIWLVFAPIKKTPSDYVAQKATELGVRALQPVITRRTIVSRVNIDRLRANAIEAAEQSGRLSVPEIRETTKLERLLVTWPSERRLIFCDEAGDAPHIGEALNSERDGPFAILSGPEGGFDPEERARIRACTFALPVSLGARILRADTAALAALAIWQSTKGDWR
jgi:16S rRNA (uracil1498-N3)-methyltransferase